MKLVLLDFHVFVSYFVIHISHIFLLFIFHQHIRMGSGRGEILSLTQMPHVQ